jgi:hypothetical protein
VNALSSDQMLELHRIPGARLAEFVELFWYILFW